MPAFRYHPPDGLERYYPDLSLTARPGDVVDLAAAPDPHRWQPADGSDPAEPLEVPAPVSEGGEG